MIKKINKFLCDDSACKKLDAMIKRINKYPVDDSACKKFDVIYNYYGVFTNGSSPQMITETTLYRLLSKHAAHGMIFLSANRSDLFQDEPNEVIRNNKMNRVNNENTRSLIKDIMKTGFSYIPVYGGYRGSDDVVDAYEPSFIVTNYTRKGKEGTDEDFKRLFRFALDMCKKYNQDTFLAVAKDGCPRLYNQSGEVVKSYKSYVINDMDSEYYTSLIKTQHFNGIQNPKRITFESFSNDYILYFNPSPATYNERVVRLLDGEILTDCFC